MKKKKSRTRARNFSAKAKGTPYTVHILAALNGLQAQISSLSTQLTSLMSQCNCSIAQLDDSTRRISNNATSVWQTSEEFVISYNFQGAGPKGFDGLDGIHIF